MLSASPRTNVAPPQDDLLAEILVCITRWCLAGRWLLQADNVLRKVVALIDQSLPTRPSKTAVRAAID